MKLFLKICALVITLGLLVVGPALLFVNDFRWFFIETPSMGMTAPVGSLVITKPQADYQSQDIIAFHQNKRVYTHRIIGQDEQGLITKGDLNSAEDAWRVQPDQIIGKEIMIVKHLGWLWRALPWLIFGLIVLFVATSHHKINYQWRWPLRLVGFGVLMTILTIWLHPWLNFGVLTFLPHDETSIDMHVVNTGIFTIKAYDTTLVSGQDGMVNVTHINKDGKFVLVPRPSLSLIEKIFALVYCLTPLIISLFIKIPEAERAKRIGSKKLARRTFLAGVIVVLTVALLAMQFSSLAGFTARIYNNQSSAKTAKYFTCRGAVRNNESSVPASAAYAMQTSHGWFSSRNETDISGNGKTGRYESRVNATDLIDVPLVCGRDTSVKAVRFNNNQCLYRRDPITNPQSFSFAVWFKTSLKGSNNGKIVGFGNNTGASDNQSDRHVYLDNAGRIVFGIYNDNFNRVEIIASPAGTDYADDQWHHVAATFSGDGAALYVDGQQAAQDDNLKLAQTYTGYWKFGCGQLTYWKNADGTILNARGRFSGQMKFGAIYDNRVLTAEQVADLYHAGK